MEIHLIWAQDLNGGIGKKGKLPWHISEDLKNFKKITLNSTVIMGRKTWDSLPFKPLPKRRNIVLSSSDISNIEVYHNVEKCIGLNFISLKHLITFFFSKELVIQSLKLCLFDLTLSPKKLVLKIIGLAFRASCSPRNFD